MPYDVNGNAVTCFLDVDAQAVSTMYDMNGNEISTGAETDTLVVMTYNVQRWRGINDDKAILTSIFEKYNPSVIAFQEYDTNSSGSYDIGGTQPNEFVKGFWDNLCYGNDYYTTSGTVYKGFTLAVASDFALQDHVHQLYGTNQGEVRGYQKMYVECYGKRIALFNTHLAYNPKSLQYAQAKELFDAVSQEPYFILMGDLNTVCKSVTDADYAGVMQQFVDAGYNCSNCTEQAGFHDTWTGGTTEDGTWEQTDNIITSANIMIESVIIDQTKIEANTGLTIDHLPMIAYLAVK